MTIKIKQLSCRHGKFKFFASDEFVGRSLDFYGDYSEDEVSVFRMVLRPDDVAVEVGSNIGALTVPMARLCKRVYAFEPQAENYKLLVENLALNEADNVRPFNLAIGHTHGIVHFPKLSHLGHSNFGRVERADLGERVELATLDDILMNESKIKFIKIDCEGSELEVLEGAEKLIERDRPILYVENDREEKSPELVGWLVDHNYRCYWHRPPLFYGGNFRGQDINVFGNIVSINMVCVPDEAGIEISRLDEVADPRIDDKMYEREFSRVMKVVDRKPEDLEARFKAAHYANLRGDVAGARELIRGSLAIDPDHVGTRAIRGLLDLQAGNFVDGWPAYELRYQQKARHGFGFREHDAPHWDGRPTDDVVLIWSEQGFGDSIMFVRFMDEVRRRAPNAILEVQPQLFELFETSGISPGRLYRLGRAMPSYDWHCSIPSLPATLGLLGEEDLRRGTYLAADYKMVESWMKRSTPRVGVCLRGGAASERAYSRDMPQEIMEPVARKYGPFLSLAQDGQWESYADTAAAIVALDLVLTVDTSVAHLAGALGVPTWLMLSSDPDWRWQLKRTDSPWYQTMRIFRQEKFMDWSNVVEEVSLHLESRIAKAA